jgi:hypothetical protein
VPCAGPCPPRGPKTLNGLILDYLETIPQPGTSLMLDGHPLEIIQTDEKAVKTVKYLGPKSQVPRILDLGRRLLHPRGQGRAQVQGLHPPADLHQAPLRCVRR